MRDRLRRLSLQLAASPALLIALAALVAPAVALARSGGGEHYVPSSSSSDSSDYSSDSGGDGGGELLWFLIRLCFEHPKIGIPLLIIVAIGYVVVKRGNDPGARTQRAISKYETQARAQYQTQVAPSQVEGWTKQLKAKDPAFELEALYSRARRSFIAIQEAWFRRDLTPVRAFISDATFQRLTAQLELLHAQGVRDAITDIQVTDVTLAGVEQSQGFDTVHLRIKAQMRDTDVPASHTDDQALAAAKGAPIDAFVEIWSFVRKPGATTKLGQDVFQGKCPNCGAPFSGGASNKCEYCNAVVNSGNYDWTLAEITQGVEHIGAHPHVDGLSQARQRDPGLNTEILEDRASLLFWKWIRAQSHNEPRELAKLAAPEYQQQLALELAQLAKQNQRRVFLECAVGGVLAKSIKLEQPGGRDEAHIEIRWSAKMFMQRTDAPTGTKPPSVPAMPQRWIFTLGRKSGATTNTSNGMATHRCSTCNAPLSESLTSTCDFCGAEQSSGERDWVLLEANTYEAWLSRNVARLQQAATAALIQKPEDWQPDLNERKRLIYTMAAMAAADGVVDEKERKLLVMCSERWSIPWSEVEGAMSMGANAFGALVPKGTAQAEAFLREVVQMALIDGKVDKKERELLEACAYHLAVADKLPKLLEGAK